MGCPRSQPPTSQTPTPTPTPCNPAEPAALRGVHRDWHIFGPRHPPSLVRASAFAMFGGKGRVVQALAFLVCEDACIPVASTAPDLTLNRKRYYVRVRPRMPLPGDGGGGYSYSVEPTNLLALAVRKVRKEGGTWYDGDRRVLVFVYAYFGG